MYVTRPLSFYKSSPDFLSEPPPEGPNSGYLVFQDEESMTTCCFGFCNCKNLSIESLPLPSNKVINFGYDSDEDDEIIAVPVVNQPLSFNCYYAIKANRPHKGKAYSCSMEEDKGTCFGGSYIKDVEPKPLDPKDLYQQFEFSTSKSSVNTNMFSVKSVDSDGFPPSFLRNPGKIRTSMRTPKDFLHGSEAAGLNSSLRAHLPNFNFSLSCEVSEPVVVGKWYCPFMFIKEGKFKDQVKKSFYYEVTLEQKWERIFKCDASYGQGNKVLVDVTVPTEVVAIVGQDAVFDGKNSESGVVWFKTKRKGGKETKVGLSSLIVDRMIWEQEKFGWINGEEKQVRIVKEEEYGGINRWVEFGCYVLAESFVVKRMNGSLVLTYAFKHTHHIRSIWE